MPQTWFDVASDARNAANRLVSENYRSCLSRAYYAAFSKVNHALVATPGVNIPLTREGVNHPGETGTGGVRRVRLVLTARSERVIVCTESPVVWGSNIWSLTPVGKGFYPVPFQKQSIEMGKGTRSHAPRRYFYVSCVSTPPTERSAVRTLQKRASGGSGEQGWLPILYPKRCNEED